MSVNPVELIKLALLLVLGILLLVVPSWLLFGAFLGVLLTNTKKYQQQVPQITHPHRRVSRKRV